MLICTHVFFAEIRFRNKKFDEICKLDSAFVEDPTPKKFKVHCHNALYSPQRGPAALELSTYLSARV